MENLTDNQSAISLRRDDFEKAIILMQCLNAPVKIGHKMRITIDYDPRKESVEFIYSDFDAIKVTE